MKKLIFWFTLWLVLMGVLITQDAHASSTDTCYDTDTVVMLHMDGADASTTFTDEIGHTFTANGNAQIDTAQFKFSTASGLFDKVADTVTTANNSAFEFGSGNFTIDFWVRFNSTGSQGILSKATIGGSTGWAFRKIGSTLDFEINANLSVLSTSWSPSTGTWYHLAVVRSASNAWALYIDGTQVSTSSSSTSISTDTSSLTIGDAPTNSGGLWYDIAVGGGTQLDGWMDELRIVKGTAVWTSNFTPPASAYTDCNAVTSTVNTIWLD